MLPLVASVILDSHPLASDRICVKAPLAHSNEQISLPLLRRELQLL
uniref:Uncharacterized protein n=1 Tax=Anguilla anguilla TaxID=7936 RepID=A0A0E9WWC3_ANGAN